MMKIFESEKKRSKRETGTVSGKRLVIRKRGMSMLLILSMLFNLTGIPAVNVWADEPAEKNIELNVVTDGPIETDGTEGSITSSEAEDELTDTTAIFGFSMEQSEAEQDTQKLEGTSSLIYEGPSYTVTMRYGTDAEIPEGTVLSVREIRENAPAKADQEAYQSYLSQAKEAVAGDSSTVTGGRFFDMTLRKKNEAGEWDTLEPAAPVDVRIEFKKAVELDSNATVKAIHLPEGKENTVLDAQVNMDADAEASMIENEAEAASYADTENTINTTDISVSNTVTAAGDAKAAPAESASAVPVQIDSVSFTAESFSVYGVIYTVDFWYGEYSYSIEGESSIMLSELLKILGITDVTVADIENVVFSDESLVKVEKVTGPEQVAEGAEYVEGDWKFTSLAPFQTEETLTISLKNGQEIIVRVTDAYIDVNPGTDLTHFAKDMDISTIILEDLKAITPEVTLSSGLGIDAQKRIFWEGTVAKKKKKELTGESAVLIYTGAASTSDGTICDVIITFSDITLFGDIRQDITDAQFVFARSKYTASGTYNNQHLSNGLPAVLVSLVNGGANDRFGVQEQVTVSVVKTGTTEKVNGTFPVTIWDLNVNREGLNASSYRNIVEEADHYSFSEAVLVPNAHDAYYLGGPNMRLKVSSDGLAIMPIQSGGNNSYETGIAAVATGGSFSFTAINGGPNTEYYLMPRDGITADITSFSGYGGSIATATSGLLDDINPANAKYLDGGKVDSPRKYDVPAGKSVTYKMAPEDGYQLNKVYVDNREVDVSDLSGLEGGAYAYTFNSVGTTHKISVSWKKTAQNAVLTVAAVTTGEMGDIKKKFEYVFEVGESETYQYKLFADGDPTGQAGELTESNRTFALAHNEKIEITVPINKKITVSGNPANYTRSVAVTKTSDGQALTDYEVKKDGEIVKGASFTLTGDTTLTITNALGRVAPTGFSTVTRPFAMAALLLLAALSGAMMFIHWKRDED